MKLQGLRAKVKPGMSLITVQASYAGSWGRSGQNGDATEGVNKPGLEVLQVIIGASWVTSAADRSAEQVHRRSETIYHLPPLLSADSLKEKYLCYLSLFIFLKFQLLFTSNYGIHKC